MNKDQLKHPDVSTSNAPNKIDGSLILTTFLTMFLILGFLALYILWDILKMPHRSIYYVLFYFLFFLNIEGSHKCWGQKHLQQCHNSPHCHFHYGPSFLRHRDHHYHFLLPIPNNPYTILRPQSSPNPTHSLGKIG